MQKSFFMYTFSTANSTDKKNNLTLQKKAQEQYQFQS
jgi:hypothetical protein